VGLVLIQDLNMFSFLKADPAKKLNKAYRAKLEEALKAQRNGNIRGYSMLTEESDAIWQQIQKLEQTDKPT
jgi:hypothetical protein